MTDKKLIRKQLLKIRNGMPQTEREEKSEIIRQKLYQMPIYQKADVILAYVDYQSEVSTTPLIERALAEGKKVYCPTVQGEEMDFYRIMGLNELQEGYKGIREPIPEIKRKFDPEAMNAYKKVTDTEKQLYTEKKVEEKQQILMLMPGTGFDKNRHRIGYGKGFYDRYLQKVCGESICTIALAFSCQIVEEVPAEEHDIRPDMIVTEEQIYKKRIKNNMERGNQMSYLEEIGKNAVVAKFVLQTLSTEKKDKALQAVADAFLARKQEMIAANAKDLEIGEANGMHPGMLDRLRLNDERIAGMAEGLVQITQLQDPLGEVLEQFDRPNGLQISKVRVPLGVIGIIYESRPNVTADAFGLCFKTGNVVILKGGKDAIHSNIAISNIIRETLEKEGIPADAIQLIENTDRQITNEFMKLNQYVDVLIPRGGAGLIRAVVENSTIPVIETGTGNCHIFIDEDADIEKAIPIIVNAKTQRIGVCNACESLVIHEKIADKLLPVLGAALREKKVEMRADEKVREVLPDCKAATEEDFGTEYLDYIISMKTVASVEEAIAHINRYTTKHSDAIITENKEHAQMFLQGIDSACVYVNASTRFTDGFEFGFGAEIGISTQKLHARGPMGLKELTTYKYTIVGNGQVRG